MSRALSKGARELLTGDERRKPAMDLAPPQREPELEASLARGIADLHAGHVSDFDEATADPETKDRLESKRPGDILERMSTAQNSPGSSELAVLTELEQRFEEAYDANGVDRSLIRRSLSCTPTERVRAVEEALNALATLKRRV